MQLKRSIGLGLLTFYGVGVMVGAGIYVLSGAVAGHVGAWAPLAFIVAGLVAAPTALSYAELSARIPESAGEAAYMRAATGRDGAGALAGPGLEEEEAVLLHRELEVEHVAIVALELVAQPEELLVGRRETVLEALSSFGSRR